MKKSFLTSLPPFFDKYILMVEDIDLDEALKKNETFTKEEMKLFSDLNDLVYEPGKWTVKDIIQHVIDNERIQSYRALRISRGDKTPLPGYDEKVIAKKSIAHKRQLEDLVSEFNIVRKGTIHLFKTMNNEMLLENGISNGIEISPLALGFVIAGHQMHHLRIIHERYKPLLRNG